MEATTPPCGADPMEATASSFRPEEPSTAAHDSMEATPPPCGVDPIEASAPSCGAASSFRPKEPSTAAHDSMEATPPPCGVDPIEASAPSCGAASSFRPEEPSTAAHDPMEATASSFRPEEPSTAAHDSMEVTPPACSVDPMEASAPSCGAACSFRPEEPSTAAHDPMEATASSFRPEEPSTAAHDSMEATASPCGADSTEATAPSCSSPLDFRPVTPSTWSSSEPVGACTSTPPLRSSAPRPKDIIRRLQAKVSKYRKTIARLRKQEKNMPRSAAEALNIIRPHVTDKKLLTLSPKGNVEEDETDLLQELSPFSLSSESLVDVVQHVPQDDFPSLENITEGLDTQHTCALLPSILRGRRGGGFALRPPGSRTAGAKMRSATWVPQDLEILVATSLDSIFFCGLGRTMGEVLQWLLHLVRPWPPLGHPSLLSKMFRVCRSLQAFALSVACPSLRSFVFSGRSVAVSLWVVLTLACANPLTDGTVASIRLHRKNGVKWSQQLVN
ncbi:uncharacterized protein ISCGN_001964 [Ixodes scapularis]